jgi:hypothetical protein
MLIIHTDQQFKLLTINRSIKLYVLSNSSQIVHKVFVVHEQEQSNEARTLMFD